MADTTGAITEGKKGFSLDKKDLLFCLLNGPPFRFYVVKTTFQRVEVIIAP